MKVKATYDVPDERISDLLFGHTMSYSDWIHEVNGDMAGVKVKFDLASDNEGDGNGEKQIGPIGFARGLSRMASTKEGARHWADFLAENDDAITCDVAWQYILLGEIVYG